MPEDSGGERTEEATPKKRQNAREEGQVAFSSEANTALLLFVGFGGLVMFGPSLHQAFASLVRHSVTDWLVLDLEDTSSIGHLWTQHQGIGATLFGFLGLIFLFALILSMAQVGLHLSLKPLEPKFNRISPLQGLQRIFSLRGLMRFTFNVLKLILIASVAYVVVAHDILKGLYFDFAPERRYVDSMWLLIILAFKLAAVLALIAAADFLYQRFQHEKDLMMTKQEVKEEIKQSDGDPLVKSRIRSIQRQLAQQRMMQEVPKASVVITNPTHVAVALKYEPGTTEAPIVVAKGYDLVAQRIKELAKEHGITMVENIDLARAIAKKVDIGRMIPVEFYQAVAEVLSYVFKLKRKAG